MTTTAPVAPTTVTSPVIASEDIWFSKARTLDERLAATGEDTGATCETGRYTEN